MSEDIVKRILKAVYIIAGVLAFMLAIYFLFLLNLFNLYAGA